MSKPKFKVGDKVRILDGSKIHDYTGGYPNQMKAEIGKVATIISSKIFSNNRVAYTLEGLSFAWDERGLELVTERPTWKVAIIPDGDKTIGRLYDGHNLVKEVSTVKSPQDEYSMEEAIKVICERLTGKTEKKEEPPKLYNGKVVCVSNHSNPTKYTVGKIYQFVNGKIGGDNGLLVPFDPVHSLEEFNKWSNSKFIEVVEE